MIKRIVKQAIKEMHVELYGTRLEDFKRGPAIAIDPMNEMMARRMSDLENRFEQLCKHLDVYVVAVQQKFEVKKSARGGASLTAASPGSGQMAG